MYPGSPDTRRELSLEARRQLVLVACTLDRVNLLARSRRAARAPGLAAIAAAPWIGAALGFITRLLPPQLRWLAVAWRLWSGFQK